MTTHRYLWPSFVAVAAWLVPLTGWCLDYAAIKSAHDRTTSLEWKEFVKSAEGQEVCWSGTVVDVKEQWLSGYKILVDMNGNSVQEVNLEDIAKSPPYSKNAPISWCGKIKSIVSVFGPVITFSNPSIR